jgi:hypothetical protein
VPITACAPPRDAVATDYGDQAPRGLQAQPAAVPPRTPRPRARTSAREIAQRRGTTPTWKVNDLLWAWRQARESDLEGVATARLNVAAVARRSRPTNTELGSRADADLARRGLLALGRRTSSHQRRAPRRRAAAEKFKEVIDAQLIRGEPRSPGYARREGHDALQKDAEAAAAARRRPSRRRPRTARARPDDGVTVRESSPASRLPSANREPDAGQRARRGCPTANRHHCEAQQSLCRVRQRATLAAEAAMEDLCAGAAPASGRCTVI